MAKQVRLSQIIAIEKQVKSRVNSEGAELHKKNQKAELFNGFTRTYEKKDEQGEELPPENKPVQSRSQDNLGQWCDLWKELLDVVATKDWGNMHARTDVVVGGKKLLTDVPVTYLIWLEKQLDDTRTFIERLPRVEPGKDWHWDDISRLYKTQTRKNARHKKVPKVIVKAEATKEHPAQTEIVMDDELQGYWNLVEYSGGLEESRRQELLGRVDELKKAVKFAREEANSNKVDEVSVGGALVGFLLGKAKD